MRDGCTRRADHRHYIDAAAATLAEHGIGVTDVSTATDRTDCRHATLIIRPEPEAFAFSVPDEAVACWNEASGWQLTVSHGAHGTSLYEGTSVAPPPAELAAWLIVALTHPALAANPETTRLRNHNSQDPGFEALLASYAPGS